MSAIMGTDTYPFCNKLAAFEVMISVRQDFRFHYGHNPVLEAKKKNPKNT